MPRIQCDSRAVKSCTGSSWLLLAVLIAGGAVTLSATPPSWDSLLGNSPFGSGPAGATPAASGALEFRGYFAEGREQYFSLYDPARRRAFWLREGQADAGLRVQGFDVARQVLSVEINGQAQVLPLKVAAVLVGKPVATSIPSSGLTPAASPAPAAGTNTEAVAKAEENLTRARQLAAYELRRKQVMERRQARTAPPTSDKQ